MAKSVVPSVLERARKNPPAVKSRAFWSHSCRWRDCLVQLFAADRRLTAHDRRGAWIIASDLARTYSELTKREGWTELSWCSIGRELRKLTGRRTVKRQGRRYIAYMLR